MATRSGSGAKKSGGPAALREELERAAEGVSFMSESDYPLRFFTLPAEGEKDLTPEGFLSRLGLSPNFIGDLEPLLDSLIEERSFDDFFPTADDLADRRGTDTDDPDVAKESAGYRRVEEALRKHLRGLTVLRVGQVEIRCYLAGLDERGHIAGLVTTAVET